MNVTLLQYLRYEKYIFPLLKIVTIVIYSLKMW
jgi:hypothetical protein